MVRLDTPLAKSIEQRMLATLRRSKYGYMTFGQLIKRAKTDRWLELSKHVYNSMEYRRLVESPTTGNIVALCRSTENHVGMKGECKYRLHLEVLKYRAEHELSKIKQLIAELP